MKTDIFITIYEPIQNESQFITQGVSRDFKNHVILASKEKITTHTGRPLANQIAQNRIKGTKDKIKRKNMRDLEEGLKGQV